MFKGLSTIAKVLIVAGGLVLGVLAFNMVDDLFSKKEETRAELSQNQADAAVESGQDAVNTVTEQFTREVERTNTITVVKEKVNEAPDVHSAHTTGVDGLCINFSICPEDSVQQPNP